MCGSVAFCGQPSPTEADLYPHWPRQYRSRERRGDRQVAGVCVRSRADWYPEDWAGSVSEVEQECGLQECGLTERRLLLCTLRVPRGGEVLLHRRDTQGKTG